MREKKSSRAVDVKSKKTVHFAEEDVSHVVTDVHGTSTSNDNTYITDSQDGDNIVSTSTVQDHTAEIPSVNAVDTLSPDDEV